MHDWEYTVGKTLKDKWKSDVKLFKNVWNRGHKVHAGVMLLGLTLFGYYNFFKKG
jgi:hypothetical protein